MKTNFYDKKATYCLFAVIAIIDVAFVFHLCFSYDAIIRPILPRLIAEDKIGNTISGANWLAYFTILSNLFVSCWFLAWSCGKLFRINALIRTSEYVPFATCATLYIFATGLLYAFSTAFGMRWFDAGDEGAIVNNVANVYQHFIVPPIALAVFFTMPIKKTYSERYTALAAMFFPLLYLSFSLFRGKKTNWYAYPIFRPETLWEKVCPGREYETAPAFVLLFAEMIALAAGFFIAAYLMIKIKNKRFLKAEEIRKEKEFYDNAA